MIIYKKKNSSFFISLNGVCLEETKDLFFLVQTFVDIFCFVQTAVDLFLFAQTAIECWSNVIICKKTFLFNFFYYLGVYFNRKHRFILPCADYCWFILCLFIMPCTDSCCWSNLILHRHLIILPCPDCCRKRTEKVQSGPTGWQDPLHSLQRPPAEQTRGFLLATHFKMRSDLYRLLCTSVVAVSS